MSDPVIRRTELMAAMALATDLAMGQPLGHFLHTTLVAVALGRAAGLDAAALQQLHEVALLRMIGCTGESPAAAHVFGNVTLPSRSAGAPCPAWSCAYAAPAPLSTTLNERTPSRVCSVPFIEAPPEKPY